MRILKLVLDNYTQIDTAMQGAKHIDIDFTKAKYPICLIIGPNGSGKTTILSSLQPFATIGNLDIRDKQNLILPDKEGHKIIEIEYLGDVYKIHHVYTPVKDKNHMVKSYVTLNGTELNPTGSVPAFKDFVKNTFGIDTDYLKLVRLGDNVKSLIDLGTADRKAFLTKMISDLEIYLKYYSKTMGELRQLKAMISHSADKLSNLGISDLDEVDKRIKFIKQEIASHNLNIEAANQEIGKADATSSQISIPMKDILSEIKELSKKIAKYEKKHQVMDDKALEDLNTTLNQNKLLLQSSSNERDKVMVEINAVQREGYNLANTDRELRIRKREYDKREEYAKPIKERIDQYEHLISDAKQSVGKFVPKFTVKELDDFIVKLRTCQDILDRTYVLGEKPMKIVIDLYRENKNVDAYITQLELKSSKSDTFDEHVRKFVTSLANNYDFSDLGSLKCGNADCNAYLMYNHIASIFKEQLLTSDDDTDMLDYVKTINKAIGNVIRIVIESKDMIERLPKKYKETFLTNKMFDAFENLQPIYDMTKYNSLYTKTVDYYNIPNFEKSLEELQESYLVVIEGKNFNIERIQADIKKTYDDIEENKKTLQELTDKKRHLEDIIDELNKDIPIIEEIIEASTMYNSTVDRYNYLIRCQDTISDCDSKRSLAMSRIYDENRIISSLNNELMNLSSKKDQYISVSKDLNKFRKVFDDLTLIKRALSSKEGIPLKYLNNYIGNIEDLTNDLLDIVYNGKINIDHFNITANEFSIPFYNRGKYLSDVTLASQGELSFLSIALSFALSSQIMSDYNIMLLDEIDGPLDTSNRAKFIKILENQIERIHSEQNFLITHNDMFSTYPVDIIDLSFGEEDISKKYPLANEIKIIKE